MKINFSQSGVIPYRKKNNSIEILLITTIKKKKWIIPKGFVEFNLTPFESAKKEALEEAGAVGSNETIELGEFIWVRQAGRCLVKIYSMEVLELLDEYPEKNKRKRKWFRIEDASEAVYVPEISVMILNLGRKID
ncbi:MAG TPA: NUDIX domain-containing protein [Ignavibacteriaceae bacterium]|nr:NUDIX domain-containing protein [Ignavibacteriaceae bacterium]